MEIRGFNENEISEENIIREYLKTSYSGEDTHAEVVSDGVTYKVLKRGEVTVFYDADGNTLFDVENKRLEKEYELMVNNSTKEDTGIATPEGGNKDVDEEVTEAKKEDNGPAKQVAKEKLEKELKTAKNKSFAEPIIGYLLKRCEEDEGVAEDVAQEHKTWDKCFAYVYQQARKQAKNNCAAVKDDVVYEWAEDYYHKDDKAEEEEKAKRESEAKAKREKAVEEKKSTVVKKKTAKAATKPSADKGKTANSKEHPKPKKNGKDMEGQMDLFSMMGI